jgi:shikimate dehydrogenase
MKAAMDEISGRTRVWGILADPIHHVRTPQALNALMRECGVDGVMVPIQVAAADLAAVAAGLRRQRNFHGVIVTVPHKTAMLDLCDEVSEVARQIGAVNAVRVEDGRLIGTMLDGAGFVGGLRSAGIEPAGMRVYLAGAGGAANAIAFALAEAGVRHMSLANRTRARAEALRNRVAAVHPALSLAAGDAEPTGHDLLVNATSLGLSEGDPLPFSVDRLRGGEIVAEIIMQPEVTPLLAAAGARGCRTHPGQPMLSSQLNLMAEFLGMIDGQP